MIKDHFATEDCRFSITGKTKRRSITPDLKKNCSEKHTLTPQKSVINTANNNKK
jgi:hypothetical protein